MKLLIKNRKNAEISSSSMSDIAFLLIIFFMLTTVFALEHGLSYRIPEGHGDPVKQLIEVVILDDGTMIHNGEPVLPDRLTQIALAKKALYEQVPAVLKVQNNTKYKHVVEAVDSLNNAGIEKVVFVPLSDVSPDLNQH